MSDGVERRLDGGWWDRVRQTLQGRIGGSASQRISPGEDAVYPTKALPRLLEHLSARPSSILLDLGPVIGTNVSFFGDWLNCKVYIEDVFSDLDAVIRRQESSGVAAFLRTCLAREPESVDAVLAWDLVDYLEPDEAAILVARVLRVVRPGGMVMAQFSTASVESAHCRKYIIEDAEHLRHRWVPFARPARRVLLGRDVERLFAPLEAAEVHLLTHRQRETLFRRPAGARKAV